MSARSCALPASGIAQRLRGHTATEDAGALAVLAETPLTALPGRHQLRVQGMELGRSLHGSCRELHEGLTHARTEGDILTEASGAICSRLRGGHAATDMLLSQTQRLRRELAATARRQALVTSFAGAFSLSDDEESLLNLPVGPGMPAPPDADLDRLLSALEHIRGIRARAAALSGQHPLALQLTVGMAAYAERGYGLLFNWLDSHCRALPVHPSTAQLAPLAVAVDELRQQPSILNSCLDQMAVCRQQPLLAAFESALSLAAAGEHDDAPASNHGALPLLIPMHTALLELIECLQVRDLPTSPPLP